MRRNLALGLIIAASLTAFLLYIVRHRSTPPAAPSPTAIYDGTSRGLIEAALSAHGLTNHEPRITGMKTEHIVTLLGDAPDRMGRAVEWYRFPDRGRVDFRTGPSGAIYVYDGLHGWSLRNGSLAEASDQVTENLRRDIKNQTVWLLPSALDERSVLGPVVTDSIGDRSMLTVALTDPEGDQTRMWFDADSFLLTRIDYALLTSAGVDSLRVVWWDYGEVAGIRTPGEVSILHNGVKVQQNRIEKTEYNPALPDSLFVRPKDPTRSAPPRPAPPNG